MTNRFRIINNVGIYDELDGRIYSDIRSICNVLNKVNNRADRNAELFFCKCIDGEL